MAHNGRTFSDCLPLTDPQEDADRFYNLIKGASVEDKSPGDTERATVGTQPAHYPPPDGRASGNVDALWGDRDIKPEDPAQTAQHHSNAVLGEFRRGREEFLNRMFGNMAPSQDAEQKLLAQNLVHAAKGDYEASKPMVRAGSSRQPAEAETLLTKTKRILSQY